MLAWMYPALEGEQCRHSAKPSKTQFVVSCGLVGWVLLCYIPQWARIVARKSAEGISAFYILLGALSGVCAVGNIMMLPSSIVEIRCCNRNARFACISNLLGMFQVTFGIACFWVVLVMYFYYSKEEAVAGIQVVQQSNEGAYRTRQRARQAEQVLLLSNGFALLILIISAIILHRFPWASQTWADILGVSLAIGACLQWLPQIVTTWRLGNLGSLSPASLCFLAPYTWTFGISMIIRVGLDGWSAWIVYVLVGTMQLVLIGFAVVFSLKPRKQAVLGETEVHDKAILRLTSRTEMLQSTILQTDERCPLLPATKTLPDKATLQSSDGNSTPN